MKVKTAKVIHSVLVILGFIALIHDIQVFHLAMFTYYTIASNILQMLVSPGRFCLLFPEECCSDQSFS